MGLTSAQVGGAGHLGKGIPRLEHPPPSPHHHHHHHPHSHRDSSGACLQSANQGAVLGRPSLLQASLLGASPVAAW